MSKRRQDTSGAFDALVHTIAGLGATASWSKLPPATAPGSLASDGEARPLAPYRASTPGERTPSEKLSAEQKSITALFALKRAPEPERGEDQATGRRGHGRGGGKALLSRQEVEPHWKRQAYGAKLSRRRWIVIDRYERGPTPEDDQIVVTRLPERQREDGLKR